MIDSLQRKYYVDDEGVLPHSMVACTKDYCFRGRKKGCGQQFADPCVRLELGMRPLPIDWHDPDEREGRIKWPTNKVAQVLKRNLYGEGKRCTEFLSRDTIQKIPSDAYLIVDGSPSHMLSHVTKKKYDVSLNFEKQKGSSPRGKSSFR